MLKHIIYLLNGEYYVKNILCVLTYKTPQNVYFIQIASSLYYFLRFLILDVIEDGEAVFNISRYICVFDGCTNFFINILFHDACPYQGG